MNLATVKKNSGFKPGKVISTFGWSLLFLLALKPPVLGNPTGGAVVAGSATIGSAGLTLSITQSTHNAIIDWQQFSIASGETTKFLVPNSSSATLNRVVGGNPSAIYGTLQSNGVLYLINPSGIVVGPGGRIDTSSFLASTLDVSNQQFLAGSSLSFAGSSTASIDNEGAINASSGGVYLIANQVKNGGALSAPQGNVGLAAGSDILFQTAGDQHLFVEATPAGTTRATGVTNAGTIRAAAAELRAVGGNAYALAINNSGSIAATGYKKINGQVYLTAEGGSITNSGQISAQSAGGKGGTIVMNGSGTSASGTVLNSGTLNASATVAGAPGGSITLKNSGGATVNTASGQILATGGAGAKGGTIETSGASLQIGGTVSAGQGGRWLLDPNDVTIDNGSGVAPDVNVTTLETGLNAGTNETVQAVGGSTDGGNIDLNIPLAWTSSATLQLTATGNINLNAGLTGANGQLNLSAGGTISDTASLSVSSFILQNGFWDQNSSTLPAFSASTNFELQNSSTFLRVTGGTGTSSPYQITDIYGLEGLASPSRSLLTANAELMNNIAAAGTTSWNNGAGFVPIGLYDGSSSTDANTYSGTFNGQGFTINGLYINTPSSDYAGLFGDTAVNALIENVNLTGITVLGDFYAGGLVGVGNGTITNVSSTGTVSGTSIVGGLLGIIYGTITDSISAGAVIGNGSASDIGGLLGYFQGGTISNSYSTAHVTTGASSYTIGGLVGVSYALISDSYSSGAITAGSGSNDVGALVGDNASTIEGSFWDTTTANVPLGVGSDPTNTTPGVTGATTTQLMSQSYIQTLAPSWNFGTVWTTNAGGTLPQLIAVGSVSGGGGGGSGGNSGGGSGGGGSPGGGGSNGSTSILTILAGGVGDSGSNLLPPAITPQPISTEAPDPGTRNLDNTAPPPLLSFEGNDPTASFGQQDGDMAGSSGNGGLVGANDAAQLGNGQLNNAANPQAASTLNLALGPLVYRSLSDALVALGDWADVPAGPGADNSSTGGGDETILGSGDVVEIGDQGVKAIPLSQAPPQLKNAMSGDILKGVSGTGH